MNALFIVLGMVGPMRPPEYLGPETLMPLASVLAAIVGFFLIFWRVIVKTTKKVYRKARGIPDEVPPDVDLVDSIDDDQDK